MTIPHNALVLVADGRKALFLRNEGDEKYPNLRVEKHMQQDNPAARDQASDGPGHSFASVGGARSALEQTDFHQLAEDRFAAETAELLHRQIQARGYEKLIVAAPPHTLGELRKHYHKDVVTCLIFEVDKDLTDHTLPSIEKILNG